MICSVDHISAFSQEANTKHSFRKVPGLSSPWKPLHAWAIDSPTWCREGKFAKTMSTHRDTQPPADCSSQGIMALATGLCALENGSFLLHSEKLWSPASSPYSSLACLPSHSKNSRNHFLSNLYGPDITLYSCCDWILTRVSIVSVIAPLVHEETEAQRQLHCQNPRACQTAPKSMLPYPWLPHVPPRSSKSSPLGLSSTKNAYRKNIKDTISEFNNSQESFIIL